MTEPEPERPSGGSVAPTAARGGEDWHRQQAIAANTSAWELLDGRELDRADADELLHRAYASAYHWNRAVDRTPVNRARAAWLIARCHTVLGQADLALHHARRCGELTDAARSAGDRGLSDFDVAYQHEALARALACAGRFDEARVECDRARAIPIGDDEDRRYFQQDLASEPWFGLEG